MWRILGADNDHDDFVHDIFIKRIEHFFGHYKDLEDGKWVKVLGWGDANVACEVILEGIERAKAEKLKSK